MLRKYYSIRTRSPLAIGLAWLLTLGALPSASLESLPPMQQRNQEPSAIDFQEAEAYNNIGVDLARQGKFDRAIAAFKQALELYPAYENAYNNLGIAYASIGNFPEAANAFREAIALNPLNIEYYNNLGSALGTMQNFSEAADTFRDAIALNPNDPDSHFNLALALLNQNKITEAIASLKTARNLYWEQNNIQAVQQIDEILRQIEGVP